MSALRQKRTYAVQRRYCRYWRIFAKSSKAPKLPSPFAGMHSQVKLGTSYTSQYGKKH
jgi:hypothetical protein